MTPLHVAYQAADTRTRSLSTGVGTKFIRAGTQDHFFVAPSWAQAPRPIAGAGLRFQI
jgi:hypothetical protein